MRLLKVRNCKLKKNPKKLLTFSPKVLQESHCITFERNFAKSNAMFYIKPSHQKKNTVKQIFSWEKTKNYSAY